METFDIRNLLGGLKPRSIKFSQFIELFMEDPLGVLRTSSMLISQAIEHFGVEIVIRSGEPAIGYKLFKDPFFNGTTAVFGQEHCIKQIVEVVESIGKESSPPRGIVLVGPPASGKTNIVDLISLALEEYSKQRDVKLYSFFFRFEGAEGKVVELHPAFRHNPIFLVPNRLKLDADTTHPRRELFEHVNKHRDRSQKIVFPTYYQNGYLDKRDLDVLASIRANPRNADKSLFDVLEEYVRIEEIDFSIARGNGISNIDDMGQLKVGVQPVNLGPDHLAIVNEHLPGAHIHQYYGALVAANRGVLHIHDAFGVGNGQGPSENEYKPLLMLLGSGKASVESTQTPIDTTVITTTNLEEMVQLERQLTSSKLLDRIEEVPVNYLLDACSEMEILRRDVAIMHERYDVDPNLLRIASYFSVLSRLLPPAKFPSHTNWSEEKQTLYRSITPEQKLFIYGAKPADPLATIRKLPDWHPFRNELSRLGVQLHDLERHRHLIAPQPDRMTLEKTGAFTAEQLKMIDDEFMRALWEEHYPYEGKHGISVRQLQNIMRDTIAHSNGLRVHVGTFFSRLKKTTADGPAMRRWLAMDEKYVKDRGRCPARAIGDVTFDEGEADYGDYRGLVQVVLAIYRSIIRREIVVAIVNRDEEEIAGDLRKYLQHVLLLNARSNQAFAHIMVPRYVYFDSRTGSRVDEPDMNYLGMIEDILARGRDTDEFRQETADRFLAMNDSGELALEEGKSAITSRNDNLLNCFDREYSKLLSHRRVVGNVDPEQLKEALFHKRVSKEKYDRYDAKVRDVVEELVSNMMTRFSYSSEGAIDTILYGLRKNVVDLAEIIA